MAVVNRALSLAVLVFLFASCDKKNDKVGDYVHKSYYKNGQLKSVSEMENGLVHGIKLFYYPTGQLQSRGEYSRGLENGIIEHFYENGKLKSRSNWLAGKEEGEAVVFFENGNIQFRAFHRKGKIVGRSTVYYDNGNVRERKLYDSLGNMQHIMTYSKEGKIEKSFVVRLLYATKDSVQVGEETIVTIKFPFTLSGEIFIEASQVEPSGETFYEEHVLQISGEKDSVRYRTKFEKIG